MKNKKIGITELKKIANNKQLWAAFNNSKVFIPVNKRLFYASYIGSEFILTNTIHENIVYIRIINYL